MLLEQFFRALPRDMAIRVREEKPKSVREASELADNYELARKAGPGGGVARTPLEEVNPAVPSDKSGPPSSAASRGVDVKTNFRGEIQCWECKKYDHMAVYSKHVSHSSCRNASSVETKFTILATLLATGKSYPTHRT